MKSFIFAAGLPGALLLFYPVLIILVTRGRVLKNASSVDGSSVIQIVYLGLCTLILFREYTSRPQYFLKKILFRSPFVFLIIYIFICFFSTLWSSNLFLTFYRSFESLIFLLLITMTIKKLIETFDYSTVIKWTIWFAFWNLFIGVLFRIKVAGFSSLTLPFMPSRLFFPLFFFVIIILGKKMLPKVLSFFIVLLGFSNKIYIGVSLGLLGLVKGSLRGKILVVFALVVLGFLISYIGINDLLLNTLFYGRDSVGIEDSSGRNQVWTYLISKSKEKPIIGYGFVSGELQLLSNSVFKGAINAHNSIISALVSVGYLGLVVLGLFFISIFKFVLDLKVKSKKTKAAFIGTVILIFVVSMSAPGIGGRVYGSWIPSVYLISLIIGLKKYYKVIP
ncbi:MAG: O-antigen ligase family protein [Winogradskyella sp.]|uniref:O-antigen ligase family protein n=1 Tax=Winogradskyella sp. TaxID=1883156 RepID=UPI00385C824E